MEGCTLSYEVVVKPVDDRGFDLRQELTIIHDGEVVGSYVDGGEPEDSCFYRDWAWVKPALEAAYQAGVEDASFYGR